MNDLSTLYVPYHIPIAVCASVMSNVQRYAHYTGDLASEVPQNPG